MRFETRIAVYKKGKDIIYCPELKVVRKVFGKEFSWCGWEDFTGLNSNIDYAGAFIRACEINEGRDVEYNMHSLEFAKLVIDCFYEGIEKKKEDKITPHLIIIIDYP